MSRPTTVALALGGGGARGYAHIGVLEVLEERGFEVISIAGTSMGALVGGLHAADVLPDYARWARKLTQRDVLRLLDPTLRAPGAIRAEKVFAVVTELLGDRTIEDLRLPYTAVATDLLAGREVWFQRGPLAPAIRASIALPSFITPVMLQGRLLADGGLLNPIPVAATAAAAADVTLAVSLSEEHLTGTGTAPTTMAAASDAQLPDRTPSGGSPASAANELRRESTAIRDHDLVRAVTGWFNGAREPTELGPADAADLATASASGPTPASGEADDRVEHPDDEVRSDVTTHDWFAPTPPGLRTLEVMQLSVEALQASVTRFRLAAYPPDVLVSVPRDACRTLEFHRAGELIEIGRQRAAAALEGVPARQPS